MGVIEREWSRYSASGRVGKTGTEATSWVSDTAATCKVAAGVEGSLVVAVTSGEGAGSSTMAVSYDWARVSGAGGPNGGGTGGESMSVSGASFGTRR